LAFADIVHIYKFHLPRYFIYDISGFGSLNKLKHFDVYLYSSVMDEEDARISYCPSFDDGGKARWTKTMVARLIDMYKERRCLYDSGIPSNREQRNGCIHEMAVELGTSGLFVFILQFDVQYCTQNFTLVTCK